MLSRTLLADVPELGQLTRQPMAAVIGGAPPPRGRGTLRGKRTIWGGRAHGRAVLYMASGVATRWNPVIRGFYNRLRAAGKAKKVALVACMRKLLTILNAMVKHETPWREEPSAGAATSSAGPYRSDTSSIVVPRAHTCVIVSSRHAENPKSPLTSKTVALPGYPLLFTMQWVMERGRVRDDLG